FTYSVKGKIKRSQNIYKQTPFIFDVFEIKDSSRPFILKFKFSKNSFKINSETVQIPFGQVFQNSFGTFRISKIPNLNISSAAYSISYEPVATAAASLAAGLQVSPKSMGTGILTLTMQSTNPLLAADVINQLMEEYGDYSKELKKRQSDLKIAFIDDRLRLLGNQLDSVQDKLLRYSQENNLIDMDKQSDAYFGNISESDKAINEQQLQLTTAEFIESYLRDKKNLYAPILVPSSLGLTDATLNGLVAEYNMLQGDRQSLLDGNVPPGNPIVVELNEKIEKLRISLLENLANIKKSFLTTISTLLKNSGKAQSQLQSMPPKARGYMEIKRQVENKQAIYNLLQEEKEKTAIS
ncbi:MAG TPA: hypothetical protein V6C65_20255, partial [Allocoleopsis sp.]